MSAVLPRRLREGVQPARPPHGPPPESELEEFFELSVDPLSIIGFDGEFKRVNASFVHLLGFTEPDLLSRSALDILHPDDVRRARAALAQLAEGHDLVRFEARVICADGAVRWLEWSTRSMPERGLVYSVGRDTTERRRVEAELHEARRSLETSRDELRALAAEQAALRRVATLVARGTGPESVFRAVADEVGALTGCDTAAIVRFDADGWATVMGAHQARRRQGDRFEPDAGYVVASVRTSRHAARFDTDEPAAAGMPDAVRAEGIRSALAAPIVVDGELWGTITVASLQRSIAVSAERRLAEFTELVATAISNTQAREELRRLADTQGALRRVATLAAREASEVEVFAAIADECSALFGVEETRMMRFQAGPSELVVAGSSSSTNLFPVGSHHPLGGENATTRVFRTGRPARVDDFAATATGPIGDAGRSTGIQSVVATPITVAGRLWGALAMGTRGDPLPAHTEQRVAEFAELMATAIANAESRARADRLADEQATLRRLATLVAREAPLETVFASVAHEVARTLGDVDSALWRDNGDGTVTAVAAPEPSGASVGTRLALDGDSVIAVVLRERRPHRIDDYARLAGSIAERARETGLRSAVGCPIVVGSRAWGVMTVATHEAQPFAPETETRVTRFSELVATAIANDEARAEVERLAREQAALRRVATLVAQGAEPAAVLDAVAAEMERVLGADQVSLARFEPGEEVTLVAYRGTGASQLPLGSRFHLPHQSVTATVRRTEGPARIEDYAWAEGPIAAIVRANGLRVTVGAPIVVDRALWGAITASWGRTESPPEDAEERMARFAELLDTAIANADSHDQLTASRARLLTAADDARRRVVRDLHDGAQQRLVHTIVAVKLAQRALREHDGRAESLIAEALAHAEKSNVELRELAHGILPAVLTRGGLRAAVRALTSRLDLPVKLEVAGDRFQADVEASAYFVVAEALTNVAKHADAGRAVVRASVVDGALQIEVVDDGVGGADPAGQGLVGVADRVTALGGRLEVDSPAGGGTHVTATFPLRVER